MILGGASSSSARQTNLDDFIPHPVVRRRRPRAGAAAGGQGDTLRQPFVVQLGLVAVLVFAIIYAVRVSIRLERYKHELSDPDASLPPVTVKYLKTLAEEQLGKAVVGARDKMAHDVQDAARQLAVAKLHESSVTIAHGVEERLKGKIASAKAALADRAAAPSSHTYDAWHQKLNTPWDLRFPDIDTFIEEELKRATTELAPRPKYNKPLDMEEAIDQRAREIDAEWRANGSVESKRPGYMIANVQKMPRWPMQIIKDMRDKETGVLGVNAPFVDDYYKGIEERGAFWWLKNSGYIIVGISSYEVFPAEIINPIDNRHVFHHPGDMSMYEAMDAWLHCSRDPAAVLPAGVPRALISESDFVMYDRDDGGGRLIPRGLQKKYDFLYVNNGGAWNDFNRNWTMAQECIRIMCEMGLKVVTTRPSINEPALKPYVDNGQITTLGFQPWRDFLQVLESSRALFTPCIHDASPRAVTEAMSLNVPVLMNTHITGGWKYINDKTGVFFTDEHDVQAAIERLRSAEFQAGLQPRQYIMENYGRYNSGLRLQAFLEIVVGKERIAAAKAERDKHPICDPSNYQLCK